MLPSDDTLAFVSRPLLGAVAFLLGAIVGSFINVVIYRLPKMMETSWRQQCQQFLGISSASAKEAMNLAFPASHCPHCQHPIAWWENIPVISYLWLRGKCSHCKCAIPFRYLSIEGLSALLSFVVVWTMGYSSATLAALFLTWVLLTLAVIDLDTQLLPDDITLPLIWLGLCLNLYHVFISLDQAVIGAISGYLVLWSVYWAFKLLTRKEGMGFGDFKLLSALGAWFGWQALPLILLLSSCVGSLVGISLMVVKKKDSQTPIPFGPYLAMAGWIYLLWGERLVHWYVSTYTH